MQSTEKTGLNWVAEFKDRWAEADALGMHGHRVEHALEPLLLVLTAERDRAGAAHFLLRKTEDELREAQVALAAQKRLALAATNSLAAERDRADRAEAALGDADEKWRFEHALYEDAILQRNSARERLSNAPHDELCAVWNISGGESDDGCTCWKSEATA